MSRLKQFIELFDISVDLPGAMEIYKAGREEYERNGNSIYAQQLYRLNLILHNSSIPPRCSIGQNSTFAYGGIGVVIHEGASLGARSNIGTNVTIGGTVSGVPSIGDDCYLSTGSKIIGNVKIGNCSIIGANSVVLSDVPPYSVVVGVPGRIANTISRNNFSKYQGYFWCKNKPESVVSFMNYHFPFIQS